MKVVRCTKDSFTVIGKKGSTNDGNGFIQNLWQDASSHFSEIEHLAKKDDQRNPIGFWGVMSDFSRSFKPWDDFSKGLYLAGIECLDNSAAPYGWTKWVIPGYEYIYAENETSDTFTQIIQYLQENSISIADAVHDFTCPKTGKAYMFFPVRKL